MTTLSRSLTVVAAGLCLAAPLTAQPAPSRGTTPGTGLVPVDIATPAATNLSAPLPAERLSSADGPWTVVAPYGWVFGIKGALGSGQRTVQVDQSVSDTANAAIKSLKGAAQLHVESGYGNYGLIADLTYLQLQPAAGPATVDTRSTLFELLGMYRVVDVGGPQPGHLTADLLAGARYYRFRNEIGGSAFGLLSATRTNDWVDPIVGARAGFQVTEDLGVFARGDIGGFGVRNGSDKACNVVVGFDYRCCECASLTGGYRWLKIDRESGVGRDRFLLDATLAGPFVAFVLRY